MSSSGLRISLLAAVVAAPFVLLIWARASGSRYTGLKPGDRLPVAELLSSSGETISTRSWYGSPTLLVLFRPACNACLEEIAALSELAPASAGVRVILLSVTPGPVRAEAPFPVYLDPGGGFLRKTRKLLVPTVYGFNAGGRVVFGRVGRGSRQERTAAFRELLSTR